jgi:hypothetical protein
VDEYFLYGEATVACVRCEFEPITNTGQKDYKSMHDLEYVFCVASQRPAITCIMSSVWYVRFTGNKRITDVQTDGKHV